MSRSSIHELSPKYNEALRWLWRLKFPAAVTAYAIYEAENMGWYGDKMLPYYTAAAIIYIIGRIADKKSTMDNIDIVNRSTELGLDIDIKETSPFIPENPTKEDLFTTVPTITEASILVPAIILPIIGIGAGIGSFLVSLHNSRLTREIKKRIDLNQK